MIQIFNELQTETNNLKFIKTIDGENPQHYYYEFDGNFKIDQKGNAFGSFKKDKFVILNMDRNSANYFKREMLFNNDAFEMVDEELEGENITVKMYFNEIFEVVKLVQQWMPQITIQSSEQIRNEVYKEIENNLEKLKI